MRIRLVKLHVPSKIYTSFYTLYYDSDPITLFEEFNKKFNIKHKKQVDIIKLQLKSMGQITGARESYFEPAEISPGDKVCYLSVPRGDKLRLYCVKFSERLVVIGSGGLRVDGKGSEKAGRLLMKENVKMSEISRLIEEKLKLGEIYISLSKMSFLDNLDIDNNVKK